MFKIHTNDGITTPIDLSTSEQREYWKRMFSNSEYQAKITGITIVKRCGGKSKCEACGDKGKTCNTGVQYSLSRPSKLQKVVYELEIVESDGNIKGGEKIICQAGEIRIIMMSHANQPACRVTVDKIGKQRYNPNRE
jgi:hypothetical protein